MKAIWNGALLAESNSIIIVEGNHYFPINSINRGYFRETTKTTHCHWKGDASYFTIVVEGKENKDAAWFYKTPSELAIGIKDHVAFWKGVEITS